MNTHKNKANDFYVGYLPEAPQWYHRTIKYAIISIAVSLVLLAILIVNFQNRFSTGIFEFGNQVEITGQLEFEPVPHLITRNVEGINSAVLLLGYGKFGARGILKKIEEGAKVRLAHRKVTLRGTRIYNEGKFLFELTDKERALVNHETQATRWDIGKPSATQDATFQGEIIDPKCYFGVMKPGEGKVHRTCAIRCISGGIPPVLKVEDEAGTRRFFLLKGPQGENINKDVLDYVADQVRLSGKLGRMIDWDVLYLDPKKIKRM